jgi:hypothetical protein
MSFVSPSSSEIGPKPADLQGHLLIITPTAYKTGITTSLGEAEAIECDVVDLDTNDEHFSVLFFNVALRSALKPNIGSQVLARIGQGIAKPGKSAPWILLDATTDAADVKKATDYIANGFASVAVPPKGVNKAAKKADAPADINDPAIQALLAQLSASGLTASE